MPSPLINKIIDSINEEKKKAKQKTVDDEKWL